MGGGNTTKQTETENKVTAPWSVQQPYLQGAFSEADKLYNRDAANPYTGDFIAQPTDAMRQAFNGSLNFVNGAGANAANTAASTGTAAAGAGLGGATGALGGLFGLAGQDMTGSNIAAASAYADNPYMSGMVDAATRDAKRQLTEQDLPALDRSAAATGNLNSSRTGVASGILQRGFADKAADISANLRGTAYQNGLNLAQGDTAAKMGALTSAGGIANSLLGQGFSGLTGAADINQTNTTAGTMATGGAQSLDQSVINNQLAQRSQAWNNLQNYYGLIGANNWGSQFSGTSTKTKTETPSLMSSLGMGVGIINSLFKCDRTVKTDIRYITTLPDGINLYNFRYTDDPEQIIHTGPMAQEVEEKYPEAIIEIDGIKHIDTTKYDWR